MMLQPGGVSAFVLVFGLVRGAPLSSAGSMSPSGAGARVIVHKAVNCMTLHSTWKMRNMCMNMQWKHQMRHDGVLRSCQFVDWTQQTKDMHDARILLRLFAHTGT